MRQADLFDPPPYRVTHICNREEPAMNVDDLFSSKYLKAEDLKGKPRTVVIDTAEELQFRERDGQEKRKIVLTFQHMKKGIILNRTNTFAIRDVYGSETEQWIGREIILYPDMTFMGEKRVPCIRVRIPEMPEIVEDPFPETPKQTIRPNPRVTSGRHIQPNDINPPVDTTPARRTLLQKHGLPGDHTDDEPPPWEEIPER